MTMRRAALRQPCESRPPGFIPVEIGRHSASAAAGTALAKRAAGRQDRRFSRLMLPRLGRSRSLVDCRCNNLATVSERCKLSSGTSARRPVFGRRERNQQSADARAVRIAVLCSIALSRSPLGAGQWPARLLEEGCGDYSHRREFLRGCPRRAFFRGDQSRLKGTPFQVSPSKAGFSNFLWERCWLCCVHRHGTRDGEAL
jgi:hypothetical protein